jgi:hypothetical protein
VFLTFFFGGTLLEESGLTYDSRPNFGHEVILVADSHFFDKCIEGNIICVGNQKE